MNVTAKQIFYFGVAVLALIALAGPMPDVATAFALLLILGVLLSHAKEILPFLAFPKN